MKVWLAVNLWPESNDVHVGETHDAVLRAMVGDIDPQEFKQFVESLGTGASGTDATLDDEAEAVLRVWCGGDPEYTTDGEVWGEEWLVYEAGVFS